MLFCFEGGSSYLKRHFTWVVILVLSSFLFPVLSVSEAFAQEKIAEELWSFGTGGKILSLESFPDVTNDGKPELVVGSNDDVIYLLDGVTGEKLWNHNIKADILSVAITEDVTLDGHCDVVVGATDNVVRLLNGVTGTLYWEKDYADTLVSVLPIEDVSGDYRQDVVILGRRQKTGYNYYYITMVAMDGISGDALWDYTSPDYTAGYARARAPIHIVIDDLDKDGHNDILAAMSSTYSSWNYRAYLVQVSGKTGEHLASTMIDNIYDIIALRKVPDITGDGFLDVVVARSRNNLGQVLLVNGFNMDEIWRRTLVDQYPDQIFIAMHIEDVSGDGRPDIVAGSSKGLTLINGATGDVIWETDDPDTRPCTTLASINGTDVAAGSDNRVSYINGQTGSRLWSFSTGTVMTTICVVSDVSGDGVEDIFAGGQNRFVYAISGKSKIKVSLTISLSKLKISPGESVSVSGFVLPPHGNFIISIVYHTPSGTTLSKNVTTAIDGSYQDLIVPDRVGQWLVKAVWEGTEEYLGAESETLQFIVEGYFLTLQAPKSGITIIANGESYLTDPQGRVTIGAPKDSTMIVEVASILEEDGDTRLLFLQWNDGDTTNLRTITLNSNMTLALQYKRQYLVGVDISEHVPPLTFTIDEEQYSATTLPIQVWFDENSTHTLNVPSQAVTDGTRYDLIRWSDQVTSSQRTISIQGPGQFVAHFAISYELVVETFPEGTGAVSGAGWYSPGSDAQITAQDIVTLKGTRRIFKRFQGYAEGELTITVTMDAPTTIVAMYDTEFHLEIDTNPSGIVSVPGGGWHKSGTQLTVGPLTSDVRVEQFEYTFQGWLVDDTTVMDKTILVIMDRPHEVCAVYYKREVLEFPIGLESKHIHVITNSSIKSASQFEDKFSIRVEGDMGTKGILSIFFPIELLQHHNSSIGRIRVLLDREEVSPLLATKENGVQVTLDYEHSVRAVDIYYNSFTLEVKVSSLFNLPVQGASVSVLWPDDKVFKTGTTDGSGIMVMKLPATAYTLQISSWGQLDTRQMLIESNQSLKARFIFYWDLLGILIAVPTSLGVVLYVRKRRLVKAGRIDPLVIKVAENYKRPLSASLLTRELELSLEDSRKALQRFVKNKQGRVYKDIDGTEYIGIPSVWKDLPGVENALLNKLLELGRRAKRAELRAWLGLPEIAFSQVMNSLEKNGYVVYDRMSDEYGLRGVS